MDPRLQEAIGSPRVRFQAADLTRLALSALDDLRRLDDGLYDRFVATREHKQEPAAAAVSLRELWDDTFRGLLQLLALCRVLGQPQAQPQDSLSMSDMDFGEMGSTAPVSDSLDLGSTDFGELLDGLGALEETAPPNREEVETAKWDKVLGNVASIEYGLRSQYTDAKSRFDLALGTGDTGAALGLLDDAQSSTSQGAHALVAAVYDAFAPDVDTTTVVPGYLTSLGRALLVRRGLAELAAALAGPNSILQAADASKYADALAAIQPAMSTFVTGPVGKAMRAADRWQMVEFERALATEPIGAARLTSEGLVKYLDSLGSINQREVLVVHDKRAIDDMREALGSARGLIDVSLRTAKELIDQSLVASLKLRGRSPVTDELIAKVEADAKSLAPSTLLERLEEVLAASGG